MVKWLACLLMLAPALAGADSHTRVLAASCAACHGTEGNSVGGTPVLAGIAPEKFKAQMQAFRSGEKPSTVMFRHAKGLTEAEVDLLAAYFSRQPRVPASSPMPLKAFY